jgi:hypothetical protein
MLNGVGGGGGQDKTDKAIDPLQKEVYPQLRVASQGKGPPACRHRLVRETKRKVLFDDLCCMRICAVEVTPPHTQQASSKPMPELELETTVAASRARRTCSQKL